METKNMGAGQLLSFVLAGEVYALDIGKVREVLEMQTITRVPRMPSYMRGIINLRGNAVPVVDLKEKFGLGRTERTVDTCIVIVEVAVGGELLVIGSLADSVREVFELTKDNTMPTPNMGTGLDTAFLKGVGKLEEQFVMILDVEMVFSG
ncbi:MAG: chemotaxis protein CheW, partial [Desulfohalobiaceae bacterium]